jgi:hypothetical protein
MKGIRILTLLAAVLAVLFLATACPTDSDDDTPETPPTPTPPAPTKVVLADGSWGTAGSGTITGLTDGATYVVVTGSDTLGVKADGTLGADNTEAAALSGVTAITGLTNGVSYDVYEMVTGANSGATSLGEDDYNTIVDISALTNSETHTIAAGSEKPAAKVVIVYVSQALEAASGAVINNQELEGDDGNGATLDYTFGTTTADGAKFLSITAGDEYIILDLSELTDDSFTTTISVKTAD